ncbi:hypothetical protein GGG16DRAFT_106362 [Schizophyllum commune]
MHDPKQPSGAGDLLWSDSRRCIPNLNFYTRSLSFDARRLVSCVHPLNISARSSASRVRCTGAGDDSDSDYDNAPLGHPPKGKKPAQRRAPRRASTSDSDDEYEPPTEAQSTSMSESRAHRPRRKAAPTQLRIPALDVDPESRDDGVDGPDSSAGPSSGRRSTARP